MLPPNTARQQREHRLALAGTRDMTLVRAERPPEFVTEFHDQVRDLGSFVVGHLRSRRCDRTFVSNGLRRASPGALDAWP